MRMYGPPSRLLVASILLSTAAAGVEARGVREGASPRGNSPALATPQAVPPAECLADTTLCFADNRFRVNASWKARDGSFAPAHAVSLTAKTGYFWFFEPGNVEVAVKILDGCSANGREWFFSAGLTSLEVTILVLDTLTGETKTYVHDAGALFEPTLDTAFAACPTGTEARGIDPEEPPEGAEFEIAPGRAAPQIAEVATGCTGDDTSLCLNGRFRAQASWQTASGKAGTAHAAALTKESGYFWFFDSDNIEVVVKALDACGLGRGEWLFAAGMTSVAVQIVVTDTYTGQTRIYDNSIGRPFVPVQDTAAFSSCAVANAVDVTPTFFAPGVLTIHAGDTVTWTWVVDDASEHSVTSGSCDPFFCPQTQTCNATGDWDSGLQTSGFVYTHTFDSAGTFRYYDVTPHMETCRGHEVAEFSEGTIVVEP